jgi:nucleoid-associated protein YgaU
MANRPTGDNDRLSLRPSRSAGAPDFSNVRSGDGKPDFSNVRGSTDTVPADGAERTYTVQSGDTLSEIAQRHYGRASAWHQVFDANRDQLDDPDLIRPGQVLRLPDIHD